MQIDALRNFQSESNTKFSKRIQENPDKKFFFGMQYKFINNPEYHQPDYYPIETQPFDLRFYTTQFNSISMIMPASPALSQWDDLPKVTL